MNEKALPWEASPYWLPGQCLQPENVAQAQDDVKCGCVSWATTMIASSWHTTYLCHAEYLCNAERDSASCATSSLCFCVLKAFSSKVKDSRKARDWIARQARNDGKSKELDGLVAHALSQFNRPLRRPI